jgi:hypothetical protein
MKLVGKIFTHTYRCFLYSDQRNCEAEGEESSNFYNDSLTPEGWRTKQQVQGKPIRQIHQLLHRSKTKRLPTIT